MRALLYFGENPPVWHRSGGRPRPYKANFTFLRPSYKIAHREGDPVGDFLFRPDRSRWGWTMPYARRAG